MEVNIGLVPKQEDCIRVNMQGNILMAWENEKCISYSSPSFTNWQLQTILPDQSNCMKKKVRHRVWHMISWRVTLLMTHNIFLEMFRTNRRKLKEMENRMKFVDSICSSIYSKAPAMKRFSTFCAVSKMY